MWHQAKAAAVGRVNPTSRGIGREHQVRKVQVLHDIPAVAACGEHLAMVSDVDTHDLNGGADHGGCGGERAPSANVS